MPDAEALEPRLLAEAKRRRDWPPAAISVNPNDHMMLTGGGDCTEYLGAYRGGPVEVIY
jgi:hypothetical protein